MIKDPRQTALDAYRRMEVNGECDISCVQDKGNFNYETASTFEALGLAADEFWIYSVLSSTSSKTYVMIIHESGDVSIMKGDLAVALLKLTHP